MKKLIITFVVLVAATMCAEAQLKKVYNEQINPMEQIDDALKQAKETNRFVICQVGGNWCPWCLRFADFVSTNEEVKPVVEKNFVFIHVNYARQGAPAELIKRLGNPGRFGFPVFVVLNTDGSVLHIQDSSFLEEDKGYSVKKTLRFFNAWTPAAVK